MSICHHLYNQINFIRMGPKKISYLIHERNKSILYQLTIKFEKKNIDTRLGLGRQVSIIYC